jgi:hypothetical protein
VLAIMDEGQLRLSVGAAAGDAHAVAHIGAQDVAHERHPAVPVGTRLPDLGKAAEDADGRVALGGQVGDDVGGV